MSVRKSGNSRLYFSAHRAIATVTLYQIQQISCDKQIAVTIATALKRKVIVLGPVHSELLAMALAMRKLVKNFANEWAFLAMPANGQCERTLRIYI